MCAALLLPGLCAWICTPGPAAFAAELRVVGWIERVRLGIEGLPVAAKLDTGADSSSLHATAIRWFVRDDGDWVAFDVAGEGGQKASFERKVVRIARIRRTTGEVQKRPTILLGVCLGSVYRLTEVNLSDRSGFDYEVLVGRRFLAGHFVVDPGRRHTVEPDCRETRAQ